MSVTTNLGLTTNLPDSTSFSDYLSAVDTNFQKIDAFAGGAYAAEGSFTLETSGWSNNSCTVTLAGLGANDCVICQPSGRASKTIADAASLFLESVSGTTLTFTVSKTPTGAIALSYCIIRGKANE